MVKKDDDFYKLLRYFIGGIFAIYGFFAFAQPEKYTLPFLNTTYTPFFGVILLLLGFIIMFYENE